MDGQRRRFGERKENDHKVNHPRGRKRQITKDCRHRRHQYVNCERHFPRDTQAAQQASLSTSDTNETRGEYELIIRCLSRSKKVSKNF